MELKKRYGAGLHKRMNTYEFKLQQDNKITAVQFPTEYFCSPQFYYTDQSRFESHPRQIQAYCAGRVFFPIPMQLPAFTEEQTRYSEFLRNSVKVGNVFVGVAEFGKLVRQATLANAVGGERRPILKGKKEKSLFHSDNIIEPGEALSRYDSKYNRSLTKRMGTIRALSQGIFLNTEDS